MTATTSRPFHVSNDPLWPLTGMQELLNAGYNLGDLMTHVVLSMVYAFYAELGSPVPTRWTDGSVPQVDWKAENHRPVCMATHVY